MVSVQLRPVIPATSSSALDAIGRRADAARLPTGGAGGSTGFASALDNALRSVSQAQASASSMAERFQADPTSASLEQTMVAMQKASIGFQSALHVRNRLVSAYTDIMNMQV